MCVCKIFFFFFFFFFFCWRFSIKYKTVCNSDNGTQQLFLKHNFALFYLHVEQLVQPKGGFDLTDPNGYKLPSLYNNLNDPNLKTYMNRRDIHEHLLTNGFITKDDKVRHQHSLKNYNLERIKKTQYT